MEYTNEHGSTPAVDLQAQYDALDQVRSTQASQITELLAQIGDLKSANNILQLDIGSQERDKKALLHPIVSYLVSTELFEDRVGYLIERALEGYMQSETIEDAVLGAIEKHIDIDAMVEDAVNNLTFEVSVR